MVDIRPIKVLISRNPTRERHTGIVKDIENTRISHVRELAVLDAAIRGRRAYTGKPR